MKKKYHVYGIGAALVDTEIEVTDNDLQQLSVDKGLMTLVDEERQSELVEQLSDHLTACRRASGGSAANTIIAVSCFGGKTFYSCKVADDDNGRFYLDDLGNAGVDYHTDGELPSGITGKCLVLITPDAERSMNTYLGISETLSETELNHDAIAQSEYLYLEGYLVTSETGRAAAIRAREIAEQQGVKTALSLSDPGMVAFFKGGLQDMIGEQVDLLFCNSDEALGWTETDILDTAAERLQAIAKTFVITLGAKGALVYDGNALIPIPPYPVTAVDSNGAGDMFAGAFLYAITQGHSHEVAGHLASMASASVVSQYGPRLDHQQYPHLLNLLDNGHVGAAAESG
ncbi:adenosine kinase [Porticoccus sp.]|uniref:adenosine kinase n=1 Tax=Porticoccus sp. TaxID=2024853 RepID=UPI003F69E89D